jgi:hypothetical protein
LETGALPIELHSCGKAAVPPFRAVSSIAQGRIARAKRPMASSTPVSASRQGCAKVKETRQRQ